MDKVEQQLECIRLDQKDEGNWAVGYAIFALKTKILCEVDQPVEVLERNYKQK